MGRSRPRLALDSSLGVHQRPPLHRIHPCSSTPRRIRKSNLRRFAAKLHARSALVVYRLRRFPPNTSLQVYCNLHRSWGSPRFQLFSGSNEPSRSLSRWRHTLRSFSLHGSRRRVTAPTLPPRRCPRVPLPRPQMSPTALGSLSARARPRGLAPPQSPLHPAVLPPRSARCSLGLVHPEPTRGDVRQGSGPKSTTSGVVCPHSPLHRSGPPAPGRSPEAPRRSRSSVSCRLVLNAELAEARPPRADPEGCCACPPSRSRRSTVAN